MVSRTITAKPRTRQDQQRVALLFRENFSLKLKF